MNILFSLVIAMSFFLTACSGSDESRSPFELSAKSASAQRDAVLSYLTQPRFAGDALDRQVFGNMKLEFYRVDDGDLYFSFGDGDFLSQENLRATLQRFAADVSKITVGKEARGRISLGRYTFRDTTRTFFIMPFENLVFEEGGFASPFEMHSTP